MSAIAGLHAPTLLIAFGATNLILAVAIWLRFLRTARAGLRSWACGLAAQSIAATLLLTSHGAGRIVPALAAAAFALGIATQARAACSLAHRRAPPWLTLAAAAVAIGALTRPALAGPSSLLSQPAFAATVLVLHCFTMAASLAFIIAARNTDSIFRR